MISNPALALVEVRRNGGKLAENNFMGGDTILVAFYGDYLGFGMGFDGIWNTRDLAQG